MRVKAIGRFFLVLTIVVLAGTFGYFLGTNEVRIRQNGPLPAASITNKLPPKNNTADFSLFWQVWDELGKKYVDKTKFDSQKMVYGAISGMVASLGDPYTVFLPPEQNKESKEDLNGNFEGIGAELGAKDSKIMVIAPLLDSPAEKAGIRAGDWIIKVDGRDTSNWTLPETVAKVRGPRGTVVKLSVLHAKDTNPVDIAITRQAIVLKSVSWNPMQKGIVYIKLARFGDQTNSQWDQMVSQVGEYLATSSGQPTGVVLDLRNNPGGLLSGAVYIASEFLRSGVVVKQQSYDGQTQSYSVNRAGKLLNVPLVVLVNGGTASAGEILGGALQAAGRGKVVGMQTFGKGSVQEAEDLPNGAGLHITIAKWLLSNGVWINGTGLAPDVKIENDPKDPAKDAQLEKAVELLSKS